jgi:hypothetical protein
VREKVKYVRLLQDLYKFKAGGEWMADNKNSKEIKPACEVRKEKVGKMERLEVEKEKEMKEYRKSILSYAAFEGTMKKKKQKPYFSDNDFEFEFDSQCSCF